MTTTIPKGTVAAMWRCGLNSPYGLAGLHNAQLGSKFTAAVEKCHFFGEAAK